MNRRSLFGMGASALLAPEVQRAQQVATARGFDVRDFGAKGDGVNNDTGAIQKAIDTAFRAGGGVAYVPPGIYLSAGIEIKSNVTLHLEAGSTILGSTNLADYIPLPGPHPGGDANDKHLVFAHRAENIGITGRGVIDGQGQAFWTKSGRPEPAPEDLWRDVATYDWKKLDRPSPMLEIAECRNVHVEGVTLKNSPGWTFRPIACESVFVRGVTIRNPIYGPNNDGIDPTCSQNVFISDCDIDTADDNICLKSENPYGELRLSQNITITNCVLSGCCNGFKIGTATRGGFENITFSNSVIYNNNVPLNQRVIAGIAIEMVDGGWVDGVLISNIRMRNVRTPIFVRLGNRGGGQKVPVTGRLENITISGVDATGAILTSSITGIPDHPARKVTLRDIRIQTVEPGKAEWAELKVPEQAEKYPEARMFGRLPSYGLYCRHLEGVRLSNVEIASKVSDPRPLLACDDVENLEIAGLTGTAPGPSAALAHLHNVRSAFIHGCSAPVKTDVFAHCSGERSSEITMLGNDFCRVEKPYTASDGVRPDAIYAQGNRTRSS